MSKFSKKDLKGPDQFQAELIKGFQWTTAHSKLVLGGIAVFIIAGVGYSIFNYTQSEKEIAVQEKYYSVEKQYNEKKSNFEQAAQSKDKKVEKDAKAPELAAASGDLQKDYGPEVESLESLVKDAPKSRGAQMAALNLSEIYLQYKKPEEALRVLKAVESGLGGSPMLSSLILTQMGNVYADQNDCKQAVDQWQKIVGNKKLNFAHDESRLRMGLCYESLGDVAKAEELYTDVSKKDDKNANMNAARDAEKYLRLLKMKKNLGSGS